MNKPLLFGATALVAGVVAFALTYDSRDEAQEIDKPVAQAPVEEPKVELADPGVIEDEPVVEETEELPEGYFVDEMGRVWEPLSFDKPQIKANGDGTFTMRKLARIYEADGSMREQPIVGIASPVHRRVPRLSRPEPQFRQEQLAAHKGELDDEVILDHNETELSKDGE